ncbi:MerR family transcriptional regulator [Saccharibacillus sp. JS10]|nr:MerR family transcriptional regulator [Saccharibacillus sp. JS10]
MRFYHTKKLLVPSCYNEQGHRLYTVQDLIKLQQILTLKFLDYPLERIAEELQAQGDDLRDSLERQRKLLRQKRDQLDQMLRTLDHTLETSKPDDDLENDTLLLTMYSMSTEEQQRQWLEEYLPASLLERFWPVGEGSSRWRAIERESIQWISRLKKLMREGYLPEDEEVKRFVQELFARISGVMSNLNPPLNEAENQALEQVSKLDFSQMFRFPVTFTLKEEVYIERMWDHILDEENESIGGEHSAQGESNGD